MLSFAESVGEGGGGRKNTDRKGFAHRKGGENRETRKKRTVREDNDDGGTKKN